MKQQHDNTYAVKHLIDDLPEAPCDACEHWMVCKHERLACMDYFHFIKKGIILGNGIVIKRKKYTIYSDRSPTKRIFDKCYKDAADGPIKSVQGNQIKQNPPKRFLSQWGFRDVPA